MPSALEPKLERDKEEAIKKIMQRARLFESRDSKLWRLWHDPIRMPIYLLLNILAKLHPLWVSKKMPWGGKMSFYLPEGNQVYYYGFCESNLAIFFIRLLGPGSIIVDVGANIGFYTALSSWLAGDTGKVLSVEATPRTFSTLNKNCDGKNNIIPINIALSDSEGEVTLMDYGPKWSCSNSLNPKMPKEVSDFIKAAGTAQKVKTVPLDKLLLEHKLHPTFIKMDVEGYESTVLRGMTETLNTARPILSIEMCKHPEWRDNVNETFDILTAKGYKSYEVSPTGDLAACDRDHYERIDIVFVPEEKLNAVSHLILNNKHYDRNT